MTESEKKREKEATIYHEEIPHKEAYFYSGHLDKLKVLKRLKKAQDELHMMQNEESMGEVTDIYFENKFEDIVLNLDCLITEILESVD